MNMENYEKNYAKNAIMLAIIYPKVFVKVKFITIMITTANSFLLTTTYLHENFRIKLRYIVT